MEDYGRNHDKGFKRWVKANIEIIVIFLVLAVIIGLGIWMGK